MNGILKELILAAILGWAASIIFGVEFFASRVISSVQTQETCVDAGTTYRGSLLAEPLRHCETPDWRLRQNELFGQIKRVVDDRAREIVTQD